MTETRSKTARDFARTQEVVKSRRSGRALYELEADAIKALANPKRLLIIDLLSDGKERTVTELVELTGISQSNVSQNLAVMRGAGLVTPRRDGHLVYYGVTDPRIVKAVVMMRAVMGELLTDRQFVAHRAAVKRKESAKRAATYAVTALAGVLALAAVAASLHPALAGQGLAAIPPHMAAMTNSGSFGGLLEMCLDVAAGDGPAAADVAPAPLFPGPIAAGFGAALM